MANRIQLRRGTAAQWTTTNPVLAQGEPGVETDTGKQKFGNGVDVWSALPYASEGPQGIPGVADDASVEALVADTGSDTRAALNATYASQFTATGSTTVAEVNAWLATAYNGPKRLVGALAINAPLLIKSNTNLDASGATITSTHVGHMIHNENYASATLRDSNITITGGKWQRNAGGVAGGAVPGDANASHSIVFRHVDRLGIRDLRVGSTGGKYMVAIGDITNFHVSDVTAESVASDTVHMTGPCTDGVVERVRVQSGGDDVVAFTTTDYISYDDVHGAFKNITVRDVTASNATRAVLVAGSANGADDSYGLSGIVVENVIQKGAGAGVTVGTPWNLTPLTDLAIRNVTGAILLKYKTMGVVTVHNSGPVTVSPDAGGTTLTLKRLVITEPRDTAEAIVSINNTNITVDELEVHGATYTGAQGILISLGTVKALTVNGMRYTGTSNPISIGGGTVNLVTVDGFRGTLGASRYLLNVTGGTTGTINVTNAEYTAADTSSGMVLFMTSAATVARLTLSNSNLTAIGRVLEIGSGSTGAIAVNLSNVTMTGCNRLMQAAGATVEILYSNVAFLSGINQPFRIYNSGVLNVRGSGFRGYTASAVIRGASEVIRIVAADLPVDVSILAKNNGDAAHNTNAGLACGAGRVISDGTNWKNTYSGLVY